MKAIIEEALHTAVESLGIQAVIELSVPENPAHGDYSTNVAMKLAGQLRKKPLEIAEELKEAIIIDQKKSKLPWLDRVEAAPPGFINLFLSEASLVTEVGRVLTEGEAYGNAHSSLFSHDTQYTIPNTEASEKQKQMEGKKASKKSIPSGGQRGGSNVDKSRTNAAKKDLDRSGKQKVMIEFADPNPFKEFHIGHLRNIALGESYCRLFEAVGHEVRRVNYQGDVGMHVAKSLWGLWELKSQGMDISGKGKTPQEKAQLLGRGYSLGATMFEEGKDDDKQEIIELNKKIYRQDPTVIELWKEGRQWSLDYFDTIYARVGTQFTRFYFESEVAPYGVKIVKEHVVDGVFEESDGAIVYKGEKAGFHTRVFVSREGYATYEGKDLALAPLKYSEYPYDFSIIMTGNEQSEYFKVMLAALKEISPELAQKTRHMPFGMVNLKEGKMSSRTGKVITAEALIEQAKARIRDILQKNVSDYSESVQNDIAEKAAIAAVKFSMLRVSSVSDIAFDIEASVSFEGDSGPYLQYTYARAKSVLRKAGISTFNPLLSTVLNPDERLLARLLAQFPDIVKDAAENYAPSTLCTYLFQLAQQFNAFYANNPIVGNDLRLALTAATAQILKNGLYLLGIETLEQM